MQTLTLKTIPFSERKKRRIIKAHKKLNVVEIVRKIKKKKKLKSPFKRR